MKISDKKTINEIVAYDRRTAAIFETYGIDVSSKSDRTLTEICENRSIDLELLLETLRIIVFDKNNSHDFNSWPVDLLAEYIEKKHHRYMEETIHEIQSFLNIIASIHRENHPELIEVKNLFNSAASDLNKHMEIEENILFPYIKKMVHSIFQGKLPEMAFFGKIINPTSALNQEHAMEIEYFRRISILNNNYNPPQDACALYKQTMELMKEFEEDLQVHIYLENNILFPKAIELENQIQVGI